MQLVSMTKKMTPSPVKTVIAGPMLQRKPQMVAMVKFFGQGPQGAWVRRKTNGYPITRKAPILQVENAIVGLKNFFDQVKLK